MNFELVSCLLLWAWGGGLWSGSGGGDEEDPHKLCVGFFFHCRGHVPHRREKLNSNQGETLLFAFKITWEESFSFNI